jgi:hypothetical protein
MAQLKALVVCYSEGDHTHYVAEALARGLEAQGAEVASLSLGDPATEATDLSGYELVCLGSPCYRTGLPAPVQRYLERLGPPEQAQADADGWGVVFIAYGSPHTNLEQAQEIAEALAEALKGAGRDVRGVWGVVGAFGGPPTAQGDRLGWLGNLQGQMYQQDLDEIEARAGELARELEREMEAGEQA